MVGGAIVVLLIAVPAVTVLVSKKRNSSKKAKSTAASETAQEPHQANATVLDMHEDARPIELSEMAIQELNGQSLQEMEHPRPLIELYAHEYPEMQVNH